MAKIPSRPPVATRNGFRGVLDFSCWRGIYYVRTWPRRPPLPRSPAVQAQWPTWAYASRLVSLVGPEVYSAAAQLAVSTQRTARDILTSLYYGNTVSFPDVPPGSPPHPDEQGSDVYPVRLLSTPTNAESAMTVGSTNYVRRQNCDVLVPFATTRFTHFRLSCWARASTSGQSITLQLAAAALPSVPLSAAGDDLVIPIAAAQTYVTPWIPIVAPPLQDTLLTVALKGSNTSVALYSRYLDLILAYNPP
jgi:hypothetical protein